MLSLENTTNITSDERYLSNIQDSVLVDPPVGSVPTSGSASLLAASLLFGAVSVAARHRREHRAR